MSWYTPTGNPLTRASGLSATIRAEFQLIKSAFDSLPSAFGTMAQQDASAVTITGGTIAVSSLTVGGSAAITAASTNTLTNKTMSGASNTFSNIPWSALTSTPTTLSGYGITNAATNGAVTGSGLTMATARLLGRTTASTGAIEELTAGSGLTLSGGSLAVDSGTTANKILKLDGSAKVPAVDGSQLTGLTGAQGAGLVLIQAQTASSSAQIDFSTGISSTYDRYILEITDVVAATDNVSLLLRVSEDGGSTFKSGASDYGYTFVSNNTGVSAPAGAASSGATSILLGTTFSNTKPLDGSIKFGAPSGASRHKLFTYALVAELSGGAFAQVTGGGVYQGTNNAINAIRLLMSSGNIASGNFALYGVKKA